MPELAGSPHGLLTLDQWDAIEVDQTRRWELSEGIPIMSPRPHPLHQRISRRLTQLLEHALPADLEALQEVEVTTDANFPPSVRAPDIVVVPRRVTVQRSPRVLAADVLLVVEIVSPGSHWLPQTDHLIKLHEYAKAGIPHYWIVDSTRAPGEQFLAFNLADKGYRRLDVQAGERVRVTEPVQLEFAVRDLTD
ncbi:MAG TPA: Uma2 family endonuclease [Aldersonia sp.]